MKPPKASFHDTTLIANAQALAGWIVELVPKRIVDYDIAVHYHPYVEELIRKLNTDGLEALLDPTYQQTLQRTLSPNLYKPGSNVTTTPFPIENIDLTSSGAYSGYNWELFFHAPLLIATHLSANQRFEEAQTWFHRIFDPTSTDTSVPAPQRFWKFLEFRQNPTPDAVAQLLYALAQGTPSADKTAAETAIAQWRKHPFNPFVVARGRFAAFQLNVVMKYLDNLIAWGDSLFRQDTIETLNEATQLYVLAANLLGPKPQQTPPRQQSVALSYAQLRATPGGIDQFGNALVDLENEFPFNGSGQGGADDPSQTGASSVFGIGRALYFCIPRNDQLLGYWDTVADRLFKLRHCMNIEGVVQQLPLFDPPIDPGALVRAAAAGLDIASIVNNINQPVSTIRGPLLLQKAIALCDEVKQLGTALLSALEKGDAEHLGALRQQHELSNLKLQRDVKFMQWKEAEAATATLLRSRETVWERYRHYKRILGASDADINALRSVTIAREDITEDTFDAVYGDLVDKYAVALSREAYRKETSVGGLMEFAGNLVVGVFGGQLGSTLPLNKNENAELNIFLPSSDTFSAAAAALNVAAPILALIPQFGAHATPLGVGAKTEFGGVQLSSAAKYGAHGAELIANVFKSSADRAARLASYYRRAEDYVLQANLATSELEQYGRQIVGALLREQVAKREYQNHLSAIDDSQAQLDFLRDKFTNEQLYGWMQGELSRTYYDCYKFAFDAAKRAEQTLKYEVMRSEFDQLNLIQFGYWDSSRKGLLAGETLALDLKRLEMAYLEQNRRDYEITRHVSLARLDPLALLRLKATGACETAIPEWLYDMDCPGHYMRRIKSVAVSLPCVTGPFTGVHCKLSLLRSSVRISADASGSYPRAQSGDDGRFRDYTGAIDSIVTSGAQNDSGLFETNLRDDRPLPFENAGAISRWRIELPNGIPQFDFETITDVVLHVRYTARAAPLLEAGAVAAVQAELSAAPELVQLFTLNYDFGDAWYAFTSAASDAALNLTITQDMFPYWVNSLGMNNLVATFSVIDWGKHKLTLAPGAVTLAGDAATGWTLGVTQAHNGPVFAFLKKWSASKVYLSVSYLATAP